MQYVKAPKTGADKASLFEDLPKNRDEKSVHLLHRGRTGYLVLNRYPYNAGHLLAIPYRPAGTLGELSADERADLMELIVLAQKILTDALHPDGFNVGFNFGAAAGAGIPNHLHAHIVPRWEGDGNFMPVLGDTRVLSDSLDSMWERLRAFCPKAG